MSILRDTIRSFWQGVLLLLLVMCIPFWLFQLALFSFHFFRNGWGGVKDLIGRLVVLNKDPSEWSRYEMKDFILAELFWLAFTVALVVANRRILRQIAHELKGVMRPNRNSRSSEPDEIGRVG